MESLNYESNTQNIERSNRTIRKDQHGEQIMNIKVTIMAVLIAALFISMCATTAYMSLDVNVMDFIGSFQ